jgi:hypothetical protein
MTVDGADTVACLSVSALTTGQLISLPHSIQEHIFNLLHYFKSLYE